MTLDERPESVEEAGALLGAAITQCGSGSATVTAPPKGMHSSFATVASLPSSQLLLRLYYLRALLRSSPQNEPLVAAPSLLAVLMKLVSTSANLAARNAATNDSTQQRKEVPPMLSTPLRKLWVDCVVLCHRLGEGLSGNARTSLFSFLKNMIALAGMNPRSAKAGGGARIAALDVIAGLFNDDPLAPKLAGWAHDVLQLCTRSLRSSGSGEPSFRISAMKMACAVAKACRLAHLKTRPVDSPRRALLLAGAMEGPAVLESVKIMRLAVTDKFPEVRSTSATFACLLSTMLVLPPKTRAPTGLEREQPNAPIVNLEEVIHISMRNIDDEMAEVAAQWSEALARCICTAVEVGERSAMAATAKRDVEADQDDPAPSAEGTGNQRGTRKKDGPVALCKTLKSAIKFLIRHFIKAGGELTAARAGGAFSLGGRSVRLGISNSLITLLRIQSTLGVIGDENGISLPETVNMILQMSGNEVERQLMSAPSSQTLDITTLATPEQKVAPGNALFGAKKSVADAGLARIATGNVIRFGLSELASENIQLNLLQDLLLLLNTESTAQTPGGFKCNSNQLQVILIEISHLLSALCEAAGSKVEDLFSNLNTCLRHPSHGVRHEAAIACAAFATIFPSQGRKLLLGALKDIQAEHAELLGVTNRGVTIEGSDPKKPFGRMFRRPKANIDRPVDPSLVHQYSIHGLSLMVAIVVRDLQHLPGGLLKSHFAESLNVAEMLVACQFNDVITKTSAAAACTCVRSGFCIVAGILATGPVAVESQVKKIFELLQKSYKSSISGKSNFTVDHDLSCVEVVLGSIVSFLSYCSELLLTVPEVLSQIAIMLEELLNAFTTGGRFGKESTNPAAIIRLKSAKASLMEAFAWLPSGSFPMAADSVFDFAAQQIKIAIAGDVTCSILPSLVTKEDLLLDAKSLSRVDRAGQVGGASDLEACIVVLTSEAAQHGERESVIHFPASHAPPIWEKSFRRSQILGMFAYDPTQPPPTPLHAAVGTWRKPLDVSCSSTVRLLDSAIQAFSATFGLKGGMEQAVAMEMLTQLVPPFLTQLASAIGMNTSLAEQSSRVKLKEDNAAVANITAVILSCLKALPLHEATHNVPIGLGPPWMNKAKDLLLTLLPSASNIVRRAAAEGLALLATLGVSEDAHFLQSAVLHSLDEVMQGNQPDGKPRTIPLVEPMSASRASSLLCLACIQRMAQKVSETKLDRTRGRILSAEEVVLQAEETLPTLQMMTRILPSVARQGFRDYFIVQTHALHAFGVIVGYSSKLEKQKLDPEDLQILRKGVELVEDNFIASWTAASADLDAGQEGEKLAAEISFLAVVVRLMALMVPSLHHIHSENPGIAVRFSCMASLVLESHGLHPVVAIECMAFFEVLAGHQHLLPPPFTKMKPSDNPIYCCVPFCSASLKPRHPRVLADPKWLDMEGCLASTRSLRAILRAMKIMLVSGITDLQDVKLLPILFSFLEAICATRYFSGSTLHRQLAAPRATELAALEGLAVEKEAAVFLRSLLAKSCSSKRRSRDLLHWILFTRALLTHSPSTTSDIDEIGFTAAQRPVEVVSRADAIATREAARVFESFTQVRWQLKSLALLLATEALNEMLQSCGFKTSNSPDFNPEMAEAQVQEAISLQHAGTNPSSRLVLHLGKIISLSCTYSVAAVDQAELPTLQLASILLLAKVIECFCGIQDPQIHENQILDQYSTQIFSSVKHSLSESDDGCGETVSGRFLGGCEAVQKIVEGGVAKDPVALKRIARPTIPSAEEAPFFEFGERSPPQRVNPKEGNQFENKRTSLLVHIGKVWTAGKLLLASERVGGNCETIEQLVTSKTNLAINAAAMSLDGARLMLGAGVTLCGFLSDQETAAGATLRGFLYENKQDMDDSVKAALVKAWSSCSCFALRTLVKAALSETETAKQAAYTTWIKGLTHLSLVGLKDSMLSLDAENEKPAQGWCGVISRSEVLVNCLYGIRALVDAAGANFDLDGVDVDFDRILHSLCESILLPAMGQRVDNCRPTSTDETNGTQRKAGFSLLSEASQTVVITEVCDWMKQMASLSSAASSALLVSILTPLDLLQRGKITYRQTHSEAILSTCLSSASILISLSKTENAFVNSMVQVALEIQISGAKAVPSLVGSAAQELLKVCLSHRAVSAKDRRCIAHQLAKVGDWETWRIVCALDDGLAASNSMHLLKIILLDSKKPEQQLQALAALRTLLQASSSSVLIGRVMAEVGAEILHFFKMYGIVEAGMALTKTMKSRRSLACADAMTIVLLAFQQLVSDATKTAYLMVVFEHMILVLRYNGLPNHPPPNSESDAALGRMAAQAIVHVARTSPSVFKSVMVSMSEVDRAALEFAVRAEMTGYSNASSQAPAKKKLNLKGFKK